MQTTVKYSVVVIGAAPHFAKWSRKRYRRKRGKIFVLVTYQPIFRHTSTVSLTCQHYRDSGRLSVLACCTAVQPLHSRKTGFSSFSRQLLEQSSTLPSHTTPAPWLAIFRQRLKTYLFHLCKVIKNSGWAIFHWPNATCEDFGLINST